MMNSDRSIEDSKRIAPQTIPDTLKVNGVAHHLTIMPWVTLLDVLRDKIGLADIKGVATTVEGLETRRVSEWVLHLRTDPVCP